MSIRRLRPSWWFVGVFAPLMVTMVALLGGAAADGQPAAPETGGATLTILDQSAAVDVPGRIRFEVVVTVDDVAPVDTTADGDTQIPTGPEATITVGRRLGGTESAVDDPNPVPLRVDTDPDRPGWMALEAATTSLTSSDRTGDPDDQSLVAFGEAGAYPVVLSVTTSTGVELTIETIVVRRPSADLPRSAPLPVAVVLDVDPNALSVDDAAAALASTPDVAITTVVSFSSIESASPASTEKLRRALAGRPVVAAPGDGIDPSSLAAIDAGELYAAARTSNLEWLRSRGFTVDESMAVVEAPLTSEGLRLLSDLGVETVIEPVVASGAVADDRSDAHRIIQPDHSMLVITAATTTRTEVGVPAAVPTTGTVTQTATSGGDAIVLRGWHEVSDPASVVADTVERIGEQRLGAVVPLGSGVADRVTAAEVPGMQPAVRLDVVTDQLHETDALVGSYAAFHVDGPDAPDGLRAELAQTLAADMTDTERVAAIADIESRVQGGLSVVALPDDQSVTLAARNAPIPLAIHNDAAGTRRVQLRFRSDAITVPEQGRLISIPPGSSSIDVELESHALGTTPLSVTVLSPDGQHVLASTRFQVRSTAVPGLGLVLAGVGLSLLAAWWVLSMRRSRRRRRVSAATAALPKDRGPKRGVAWDDDDVPSWLDHRHDTVQIRAATDSHGDDIEPDEHEPTLTLIGRQIDNDRADDRERVTAGDKL